MSSPALPVVALLGSPPPCECSDRSGDNVFGGFAESPHTFAGPEVWGPASRFLAAVEAVGVLLHRPLIYTHLPNGSLFCT